MTTNKLFYTTIATAILTALAGAWVWFQLPADAMISIHWNIKGAADGFASKTFGLFAIPALILVLSPLIKFLPSLEPRRENLEASMKLLGTVWVGTLAVISIAQLVILSTAMGYQLDVLSAIITAMGVLFILIGNVLGKSKSTFFLGFRTPWTLSSENVWNKTHRLVGKLFMAAGIIVIFLPHTSMAPDLMLLTLVATLLAPVLVGVVYSFLVWKKEQKIQ